MAWELVEVFSGAISGALTGASILTNGYLDRKHTALENDKNRLQNRKNLEDQWALQQKHLERDLEHRLELAKFARDTAIGIEDLKRANETSPWKTPSSVILSEYKSLAIQKRRLPLFLAISPPTIDYDPHSDATNDFPPIENELAHHVKRFLRTLDESRRPIIYRTGLWDTKRFHGEAAAQNLFAIYRTIPVLLLESELSANYLNIRASTWGLYGVDTSPIHQYILERLPYRDVLAEFAKQSALVWEKQKCDYLILGRTPEEITAIGGEDESNLRVLQQERRDRADGLLRPRRYRSNSAHYESLAELLAYCHNLTIGIVSDMYSLLNFGAEPVAPRLLTDGRFAPQGASPYTTIADSFISVYADAYRAMRGPLSTWLPDLYLDLAIVAADRCLTPLCADLLAEASKAWLMANHFEPGTALNETIVLAIKQLDYAFVRRMKAAYEATANIEVVKLISQLLATEEPHFEQFL